MPEFLANVSLPNYPGGQAHARPGSHFYTAISPALPLPIAATFLRRYRLQTSAEREPRLALKVSPCTHYPAVYHATLARNLAWSNGFQKNAPSVTSLDLLRIALRWVHLVSAVIWIGGTIFYLFAIRPSLVSDEAAAGWRQIREGVERRFHEIVQVCIWTFLISGAILTYDRLTTVNPGLDYIVTLAIKVLLVVWMIYISGGLRRSGARRPISSSPRHETVAPSLLRTLRSPVVQIAIIGSLVLLLADILKVIAENALRAQ